MVVIIGDEYREDFSDSVDPFWLILDALLWSMVVSWWLVGSNRDWTENLDE